MNDSAQEPELLFSRQDSTATVVLNRPKIRNALTFNMYSGLAEYCQSPPQGVRAIIVRGAGDAAFAAGTDIRQFRDFDKAQDFIDYENRIDDVLDAIETCPVPTIAAMSGACTGGGAMIASVCDLRICASNFKFGFPIARTLGNCLSSRSLSRLGSIIGAARTRELIFTSKLYSAEESIQAGVVSEILPDTESLFTRAAELADTIAGHAPLTMYATKILQHRILQGDMTDEDMVLTCYQSEDFRHGLEAFLAKRKPEWKGK